MDNQHKHIRGYRDLSPEEVGKMNAAKGLAEQVGAFIETLESEPTLDKRWLAIGKTDLQKGFMAVIRSIAQPTTF